MICNRKLKVLFWTSLQSSEHGCDSPPSHSCKSPRSNTQCHSPWGFSAVAAPLFPHPRCSLCPNLCSLTHLGRRSAQRGLEARLGAWLALLPTWLTRGKADDVIDRSRKRTRIKVNNSQRQAAQRPGLPAAKVGWCRCRTRYDSGPRVVSGNARLFGALNNIQTTWKISPVYRLNYRWL